MPPSLHSFGGDSIAATPFLHSAGSVTTPPSLHFLSRCIDRRTTIVSAGRPISSLCRNHFSGPANPIDAPQSFQRAGESHRCAAIISAGQQNPSPVCNHFSGTANLIAQSFQGAGKSHRRTAIISLGWRIPSPSRNLFSRPAHSIVAPQSFQRSGKSHHRATIISTGQQTQSFQRASASHRQAAKSHLGRRNIIVLPFYLGRRIIVVPSYQI